MAYGDFEGLTRRTASVKILRDKTSKRAKSPKYDGYQTYFASIILLLLVLLKMKI